MAITLNGSGSITGLSSGAGISASALSGQVPDANAPSGSVIQIVQTVKTDTWSSTSSSFTDITGLSVTITPSSSSSKILVLGQLVFGQQGGSIWAARLLRDGTLINAGNASGSAARGLVNATYSGVYNEQSVPIAFLDSPATTSSVTYKIQAATESGYNVWLNRPDGNLNDNREIRASSNLVVMEIAA
jgi:hypothetical protein